jgi:hypothetical protein
MASSIQQETPKGLSNGLHVLVEVFAVFEDDQLDRKSSWLYEGLNGEAV